MDIQFAAAMSSPRVDSVRLSIIEKELKLLQHEISLSQRRGQLFSISSMLNQKQTSRHTLRTVHHMACTGGTLIAKCIAALPNALVLNEVNPFSELDLSNKEKPGFQPRDFIALVRQSGVDLSDDVIANIFCNQINALLQSAEKQKKQVVLREHTHSSYMVGERLQALASVREVLAPHFNVKSIVTVRNPIDSYLSLLYNNWLHFQPSGFDEYCNR